MFKNVLISEADEAEKAALARHFEDIKKLETAYNAMSDGKDKADKLKVLADIRKNAENKQQEYQKQETQTKQQPVEKQTQQAKPNVPSANVTPPPQQPAQTQQAKQGVPPPAEEAPKPSADVTPPPQPQAAAPQQPAAQPAQKTEAPTDEEKTMLQKLHNSPYDPKSSMDKRNLEILRQARQEVGKDANLKTLANAVYAKQYAKGDAQKKGTANVQPTTQQPAPTSAPAPAPQLNAQNVPSVQAVQQMKAPQEPFKMQAPQQTGTLAQGPTNAAATAQQAQKQPSPINVGNVQIGKPPVSTTAQAQPLKVGNINIGNPTGTPAPKRTDVTKVASTNEEEENCEDCENNCEKCKKNKSNALNKITVQEKVNISKFLKHLSEKNYSSAHKYLKAIVDDKVKAKIAQRIAKI